MTLKLAILYSRGSSGIQAPLVTVEVHLSNGLPYLSIVGLPETAVKESKDRVRSALLNTHFEYPPGRIIVNLAPADLPKEGGRFDLPIALGILAASRQIPANQLAEYEFAGELALSGALRPIQGALPFAIATHAANRQLVLPYDNVQEASLLQKIILYPAKHLLEVCGHLLNKQLLTPHTSKINYPKPDYPDLSDVRGQQQAKRALEIAAAGEHSLLMVGPPGTGKTMLASRLPGILPEMTEPECLETASILSISQASYKKYWKTRQFRAPHHTASSVALVGGGSPPKPGEISLAHNGILFLDELAEFSRVVLEALREPLESGYVTISRASFQAHFPANFQLVAALNPCPCGYLGDNKSLCRCTSEQIQRYQGKISGPLLDRIDVHVQVPPLPAGLMHQTESLTLEESSDDCKERVIKAREIQQHRNPNNKTNAKLATKDIEKICNLKPKDYQLLDTAMEKFGLSPRAYHRILKVARTIADLAGSSNITTEHLTESLGFRCLDKNIR